MRYFFIFLFITTISSPSPVHAIDEEDILIQNCLVAEKDRPEFLRVLSIQMKNGVEIIRNLYEKILGLDHHFTAMDTYENIFSLSNPNSYPEFREANEIFKGKLSKKNSIQLPAIMANNPIIATSFTLVSSFVGGGNKEVTEEELEKAACIMDFTIRMGQDLRNIYYETKFLKMKNDKLMEDCSKIFASFTKPTGYFVPLEKCREQDDWEQVYEKIDELLDEMEKLGENDENRMELYKILGPLQFNIDALIDFVKEYTRFVDDGEKYYQKFALVISSYENKEVCIDQLPTKYKLLEKEIDETISKFQKAYNLSDLGTMLKRFVYSIEED